MELLNEMIIRLTASEMVSEQGGGDSNGKYIKHSKLYKLSI